MTQKSPGFVSEVLVGFVQYPINPRNEVPPSIVSRGMVRLGLLLLVRNLLVLLVLGRS